MTFYILIYAVLMYKNIYILCMEDSNGYGPEVINKPNCAVCFHDSEESIAIVCDHSLIWFLLC